MRRSSRSRRKAARTRSLVAIALPTNRLGRARTEDLGGGLKAFQLETFRGQHHACQPQQRDQPARRLRQILWAAGTPMKVTQTAVDPGVTSRAAHHRRRPRPVRSARLNNTVSTGRRRLFLICAMYGANEDRTVNPGLAVDRVFHRRLYLAYAYEKHRRRLAGVNVSEEGKRSPRRTGSATSSCPASTASTSVTAPAPRRRWKTSRTWSAWSGRSART